MARVLCWTSVTVLFFSLFQAAILSNLVFLPAMPDLVLLVAVYISFMNGSVTGSSVGFISGLLLDFLSAAPIGLNAFTKALTGFVAGRFSGSFNMDKILIPAVMGIVVTLFKALVTAILSLFFGTGIIPYDFFAPALWLECIMNMICAPLMFALLGLFPSVFVAHSGNTE